MQFLGKTTYNGGNAEQKRAAFTGVKAKKSCLPLYNY